LIRLAEYDSPFGTISIWKSRKSGSLIYQQNGHCQSEGDGNGTSLAGYVHAIFGLIWQSNAQSILIIGCAGGTLATMLARASRKVAIVDINPTAFALAKLYFEFPPSVVCHIADGEAFLAARADTFDSIVLDAYQGDVIPRHLRTARLFQRVRKRLRPKGTVFANVHLTDRADDGADRLARAMAGCWADIRILDTTGLSERNAIVMAGSVAALRPPTLIFPPIVEAAEVEAELRAMRFRKP